MHFEDLIVSYQSKSPVSAVLLLADLVCVCFVEKSVNIVLNLPCRLSSCRNEGSLLERLASGNVLRVAEKTLLGVLRRLLVSDNNALHAVAIHEPSVVVSLR